MNQSDSSKPIVISIIVASVLFFAGLTWLLLRLPSESPTDPTQKKNENVTFDDSTSPTIGLATSTVVVHLMGDFECPACRLTEPAVKTVINAYKDRVKFVWKDFPLTTIHTSAEIGAVVARCAQDQGKFWEYHDALYADQEGWVKAENQSAKFMEYATQLGLDTGVFSSCLANRSTLARVQADQAEGMRNAVDRTPTFFINNKRYFGMNPTDWFKAMDEALAEKTPRN